MFFQHSRLVQFVGRIQKILKKKMPAVSLVLVTIPKGLFVVIYCHRSFNCWVNFMLTKYWSILHKTISKISKCWRGERQRIYDQSFVFISNFSQNLNFISYLNLSPVLKHLHLHNLLRICHGRRFFRIGPLDKNAFSNFKF